MWALICQSPQHSEADWLVDLKWNSSFSTSWSWNNMFFKKIKFVVNKNIIVCKWIQTCLIILSKHIIQFSCTIIVFIIDKLHVTKIKLLDNTMSAWIIKLNTDKLMSLIQLIHRDGFKLLLVAFCSTPLSIVSTVN